MELRKGIEKAGQEIVEKINQTAEKIAGDDKKVAEVATISAGDPEIGKLIADVISKIGKDGIVTVEAGQGLEMEQEIVEGFSYDKGYSSSSPTLIAKKPSLTNRSSFLLIRKSPPATKFFQF